jgi:hypothetical protein
MRKKKKKDFLPYLLPLITLVGIAIFAFSNPEITGLAVANTDEISSRIRLDLSEGVVVPADAIVEVYLDDQRSSLSVEEFIEKTGEDFRYEDGVFVDIGYKGGGYTGNFVYRLGLEDFGLGEVDRKDSHVLRIKVVYGSQLISESERIIR